MYILFLIDFILVSTYNLALGLFSLSTCVAGTQYIVFWLFSLKNLYSSLIIDYCHLELKLKRNSTELDPKSNRNVNIPESVEGKNTSAIDMETVKRSRYSPLMR